MKHQYTPSETLQDDLKLISDTHKKQDITGYFLLTTIKTGENESKSSLYLHNAENYITLLGFLEILVLEIKHKLLLAMMDPDPLRETVNESDLDAKVNSSGSSSLQ